MQTLESLKRKIGSAEDLETVVRTMKTLAAVSIRQYEAAVDSLDHYDTTIREGFRMILGPARRSEFQRPSGRDGRLGAIVFGTDQGMCGQFNEQVAASTLDALGRQSEHPQQWSLLAIGTRVAGRFQDAGLELEGEFAVPGSVAGITSLVQQVLTVIEPWRAKRTLSRVLLFYNRRRSASSYQPHEVQLLPVSLARRASPPRSEQPSRTLPMYTIDRDRLLSALFRQFLFVSLFRACAESLAAENAARIASMQAAERNITDRLEELRTEYHQLRQTAVTEELLDVVTGFEALNVPSR